VAYFITPRASPKGTEKLKSFTSERDWPPTHFRLVSGVMQDAKTFILLIGFKLYILTSIYAVFCSHGAFIVFVSFLA